ncbi:MAG: nucleoside deaminase [Planctomycetota bacterium]
MHEDFMRKAIEIAREIPDAPFAALLVNRQTGRVVAEGRNRWRENPTWHGEMDAINRYAAESGVADWPSLRLYTTAEPCCMCQGALIWAGIPELVYGTSIKTLQRLGWEQIDIAAHEVAQRWGGKAVRITGGVLEEECDALFSKVRSK